MEAQNNPILQEDLEIIAHSNIDFKKLENSTILITGATGLIGSHLVKTIACINRVHDLECTIILLVRNLDKANAIFGTLLERSDVNVIVGDVTQPYEKYLDSSVKIDYIFHAAAITNSKIMVEKPVDTIYTSLEGCKQMLELAKEKNVSSFVYISSMEVYGTFSENETTLVSEEKIGYLNPLLVRSNYPESKRMCENLAIAYASQFGLNIKIARLSQTFGAGILPGENRVFAQFAKCALDRKDIVLHTTGESEGNYCYTRDTVSALLILLNKGVSGQAYNISNPNSHISIYNMARFVAENIAEGQIDVIFDIPEQNIYGYAAPTKMKLDSSKMQELGWEPQVDLLESYQRMIASLK
ncbi:TPA: NAD-dependent epimerase/dehydratase family protein [Streptococcus suis]|nr:NAD-dependent epimerase/dehydratase family protein [Streptococcus suis]